MNFLAARVSNTAPASTGRAVTVALADGAFVSLSLNGPAPAHGEVVTLGIRPEALVPSVDGVISGTVRHVERLGSLTLVHLSRERDEPFIVQTSGSFDAKHGDTMRFVPAASGLHLFDTRGLRIAGGEPFKGSTQISPDCPR
jgi:multiple sugar transport system ATP-binding protein